MPRVSIDTEMQKKPLLGVVSEELSEEHIFSSYPLPVFKLSVWVSKIELDNVLSYTMEFTFRAKRT